MKYPISCVALDLDRTTLNAQGTLSSENRRAILQALAQGIRVVIASGRAYDTLPPEVTSLPGIEYAITSNGAAVYRLSDGACLQRHRLHRTSIERILALTDEASVTYEAFIDGKAYADRDFTENPMKYGASSQAVDYVRNTRLLVEDIRTFIAQHADCLESMDIVVADPQRKQQLWSRLSAGIPDIYITSSVPQLIEIAHCKAGKHTGLQFVTELLGIDPKQTAAFGDGDNDIEMLSFVGYGIAVANASEHCLQAARWVTRHHDENGVAWGLQELLQCIPG